MKVCTICCLEKERTAFTKDKRTADGLGSWCKPCKSIKDKEYRNKHPERVAEKAKWKHKKIKYGVSQEAFNEMIERQGFKCLICENDISEDPHIDHNHETGEIRGLLCKPCNRGLGFFRDTPFLLQNAYQYLIEKGHYGQQAS